MKEVNPVDALRAFVARYDTQREAAEALNIGQVYLSDMLRGNRAVSESVLTHLGLRKAIVAAKAS